MAGILKSFEDKRKILWCGYLIVEHHYSSFHAVSYLVHHLHCVVGVIGPVHFVVMTHLSLHKYLVCFVIFLT